MRSILALISFLSLPALAQDYAFKQRYVGQFQFIQEDRFRNVNAKTPDHLKFFDMKVIEAEYEVQLNPNNKFEFEVEYEHGGVGASVEYDNFDEFGEFETEVEKGGEVMVSEAFLLKKISSKTELYIGKSPVNITLNNAMNSPLLYSSNQPSQLEYRMLPQEWSEMGIQSKTRLGDFSIYAGIISGLNSELFRKEVWVADGYQKQFETINANSLAYTAGLEWGDVVWGRGISVHYYTGDTTKNRYKLGKLTTPSKIEITSLLAQWKFLDRIGVVTQHLRGTLENSDKIVTANGTNPGLIKPKNASIGSKAELQMYQLNFDATETLNVFYQYEHVNTFKDTEGNVNADPRYNIIHQGGGFAYKMDEITHIKAHYYRENTKLDGLAETKHFVLSLNLDTGEF